MAEPVDVALSLGGNLGDVPARFAWAAARLAAAGLRRLRRSHAYRTAPVGCPPGTPDFWNAALTGTWPGDPHALLALCKRLEQEAGRPAAHRPNQSRPLDLDLVLFGNRIRREPDLILPHPEAARRLFVLLPLAEIAPRRRFPGRHGRTVAALLAALAPDPDELARVRASARPWPDAAAAPSCTCSPHPVYSKKGRPRRPQQPARRSAP